MTRIFRQAQGDNSPSLSKGAGERYEF